MRAAIARRALLTAALGAAAGLACGAGARAATPFPQWVENFRPRARARGVSDATYTRVMGELRPDTSVYAAQRDQPEFREPVWQYINRRVSGWRVETGKERAKTHAALLERVERDYGVDRYVMLGVWGMESAFGEVVTNPKYMRPVIPALAALAWGEPRRRAYWEAELLNALVIIERGWSNPSEMVGSWAGAMGHTQWMPEVWLRVGVDYDGDGRISPFGKPDDAIAGTARFLRDRGKFRPGESWGTEVKLPPRFNAALAQGRNTRTVAGWQELGVGAIGTLPAAGTQVRLWLPIAGGPAFLLAHNFFAVRSYNPSSNYALALVHLGDRIRGAEPFAQQFPGGERALTLAEMQELERRLSELGIDPEYTDGRVGRDTIAAIRAYQRKVGIAPVDGYPGLNVLARLRHGS